MVACAPDGGRSGRPAPVNRVLLDAPAHPSVKELLAYWQSKCAASGLPGRDDIGLAEIPRLIPHLAILEPVAGTRDWTHRLVGTRIAERYGSDATGRTVGELYETSTAAELQDFYAKVAASRMPAFVTGRSQDPEIHHILYEGTALPILGRDGVTVWILVGLFFHA
jgi:hypothetical protein